VIPQRSANPARFAAVLAVFAVGAALAIPALHPLLAAAGAVVVLGLVYAAPPEIVVVVSIGLIATTQRWGEAPISIGPVNIYGSDVLVALVVFRALRPAARFARQGFSDWLRLAIGLVGVLMLLGIVTAVARGTPIDEAVRSAQALFYWPMLFWGYSRLISERSLDAPRLMRLSLLVGVGLTAYMFLMRALDRPFERPGQIGTLGIIQSSSGDLVRRDFGFASAFIFYPTLALLGVSVLIYTRRRVATWSTVALIGIIGTVSTLIRAEIFGLIGGVVTILLLAPDRATRAARDTVARRWRVLVTGLIGLSVAGVLLATVDPGLAQAIRERALPFGPQSTQSVENREYRVVALESGFRIAENHVFGLGFVSPDALVAAGVADLAYLAHSAPGAVLTFLGLPGLFAISWLLIQLFLESARAPAATPWLHPFFAGVLAMMTLYGFGAIGLFGQSFVIFLGAFILAVRFSLTWEQVNGIRP
jgi:hypothetical protein